MLEQEDEGVESAAIHIISDEGNMLSAEATAEVPDHVREALQGICHALGHILDGHINLAEGTNDFTLRIEKESGDVVNLGLFAEEEMDDEDAFLNAVEADVAEEVQRRASKYAQRIAEKYEVDADELAAQVAEVTAEMLMAESDEEE